MMTTAGKAWQCEVCGYIHHGDDPPDECPICGAFKIDFSPYSIEDVISAVANIKSWRCMNCTYIYQGDSPPLKCPVCGADKDSFEPLEANLVTAGKSNFDGHLVVIGAGIAGISAIDAFRKYNTTAKVSLISKEVELPYYRLNLTRFLAGEISYDDLVMYDQEWFQNFDIDLKLGCEVTNIALHEKTVTLSTGGNLPFDRIILANGAHPFIPPICGNNREGFTVLRTAKQAEKIRQSLQPGINCVVIGGGVLGLEVAGALVNHDVNVTLLESHQWLMPRQLNKTAAEILQKHVQSLNINVLYQARTKEIKGNEQVSEILLEDDRQIPCDMAVLCTGVRPNSHLARRIGLEVNQGIVVNNYLQTSDDDIYAAGDVAEHHGVLYGNWSTATAQGSIAGMNAAGVATEFGGVPRANTLKVLGIDLMSIGQFDPLDGSYQVLESGSESPYYRFVFHDNRLLGAVLVGDTTKSGGLKKAIQDKTDFSACLGQHLTALAFYEQIT